MRWTAFDLDSEDHDGDGVFEPGEDTNGNRRFDQTQVGVAFDWYWPMPGEDPVTMGTSELEGLRWRPCTRVPGEGDTDSFRASDPALAVYGAPDGRSWTFVWDTKSDTGLVRWPLILRARVIDSMKNVSEYVYVRTPFTMDD